jgi:4-hydroxy-2-oxoheptanedioate aldolase
MTYPPEGARGWGPMVAHARHATTLAGYADDVAPHLTCCVLLETVEAVEHAEAILAVDGIDLAVLAPYDLSTALGVRGRFDARRSWTPWPGSSARPRPAACRSAASP